MFIAQLNFNESVGVAAANAAFTAILVGVAATFAIKRYDLRHQTRTALRETYARLLVAQRRSREASVRLADFRAGRRQCRVRRVSAATRSTDEDLEQKAQLAHDEFIETYHRLNLDASKQMWREARGLRNVIGHMLELGKRGDAEQCRALEKIARKARQNLERSFRVLLGHKPLRDRNPLGQYDKQRAPQAPPRNRFALRLPLRRKNQS
ncbi:hypothetical protein J7F03_40170 [Streptomyces sp. ISL-43]|uniref:hypothetical protein n=1 Tax=Streptomyces sp. ISL-43 TaxID=2819183 RepID=UPI001BED1D9B|nr:hypothetical protein [Streptomyces sp. ISL-43]MBT2453131.1 hypothetical protein [Streptomyces sp. ISL-43]